MYVLHVSYGFGFYRLNIMLCCGGKGSGKHGNNITIKKLFLDHSVNKTKTVPRHLSPPGRGLLMEEMGGKVKRGHRKISVLFFPYLFFCTTFALCRHQYYNIV